MPKNENQQESQNVDMIPVIDTKQLSILFLQNLKN